jgi:predicted amidophosphoribosyltransferase
MNKKEAIARKIGKYLESRDWTVFETNDKCENCDHSCSPDANFCSDCGAPVVKKESQKQAIDVLYQAYLIGKKAEASFNKASK